jgi:Fe(3+) dicitrate transport protein
MLIRYTSLVSRSFVVALLLIAVSIAFGQSTRTVTGRVTDGHGSAVAGARVVLEKANAGYKAEATTGPTGGYAFSDVPIGQYSLTVTASSFSVAVVTGSVPSSGPLDIMLEPRSVAAEVSVTTSYLDGSPGSISEVPGSIERLDPRILENSRVFNFAEALRKISGVNVRDEEGFGLRPNIGIRGTNPTRSTKVLLLEDGVPLGFAPYGDNSAYYHPPVERYESIEVLKGSGQIAYGPQTIAGLINYLTPNPPTKPTLNVRLEGGNERFFSGLIGGGATFGDFGFITNFNHKRGDGSRENTRFKLYDLASKATYTLNDRNAFTAKFSYFHEDSNLTYTGATEAEYAANPRGNIFKNDFFYGRRYGVSLQHAAVLTSRINLTTNFYSHYFSRDWWRQTSNSGERPLRLFRPTDPTNPISDADCLSLADLNTTCGNRGNLRDYLTLGVEPRLTATFGIGALRNELEAGLRIHREDQHRESKYGDAPNSRDGIFNERNERRTLAYSGYIQNRFSWKSFSVTPGVRVENIHFERTNLLTTSGTPATGTTSLTQVIPGISFAYTGIRNTTVFAGVHRGFAPPRVEDVITNAGGVIDLDSELSWNYEAGFRSRPVTGVDVAATFFRNDYENQIVASSIASGTQLTNGGKTLQQGFEFSGSLDTAAIFRSPHNFYFRTAYTFLPIADFRGPRLSSVTSAAILNVYCPADRRVSTTACTITANRVPYAPKHLLTSSVGYSHASGFDGFLENVYISRQFGDDLNAVSPTANGQIGALQGQTYWNATANYKVEKWKTTFFVTAKNIFDRTFIVDRARGILPSTPRLVQAGVAFKF